VLHSLRHGGITKLHAAGVAHSTVEVLAGHASNNVHGQVYIHREGLPLSLLKDGLEKLRYDDVLQRLTTKEGTN
jgi:integrase